MPATLRIAIGLLWAQFVALLGLFAIFVFLVIREPSALGFYVGAFAAIFTLALLFVILALGKMKLAARGGVLALELLALAPAYYMITGGRAWLGWLIGAVCAAVMVLLLLPSTSRVLR